MAICKIGFYLTKTAARRTNNKLNFDPPGVEIEYVCNLPIAKFHTQIWQFSKIGLYLGNRCP